MDVIVSCHSRRSSPRTLLLTMSRIGLLFCVFPTVSIFFCRTGVLRGFQLVKDEKDPETGQQYELTHEDYVEAAQRCLAIEKEM
jgi:hypothetical protein